MTDINLVAAAKRISSSEQNISACEIMLAHAIEHGHLQASIRRWTTEQWLGNQLPGNIDRLETYIKVCNLEGWLSKIKGK